MIVLVRSKGSASRTTASVFDTVTAEITSLLASHQVTELQLKNALCKKFAQGVLGETVASS